MLKPSGSIKGVKFTMYDNQEETMSYLFELNEQARQSKQESYRSRYSLDELIDEERPELGTRFDKFSSMLANKRPYQEFLDEFHGTCGKIFTRPYAAKYLDVSDTMLIEAVNSLGIDAEEQSSDYERKFILNFNDVKNIRNYLRKNGKKLGYKKKFAAKSDRNMCLVITVANKKGGTGKTTIVHLLASYLAIYHNPEKEYRVLIVDLDYQQSISMYYAIDMTSVLGLDPNFFRDQDFSSGDIINADTLDEAKDIAKKAIKRTHNPHIDIIPARARDASLYKKTRVKSVDEHGNIITGSDNDNVDFDFDSRISRLSDAIEAVKGDYDFVVIDTSPAVHTLAGHNAIYAANSLFITSGLTENDVKATEDWCLELYGYAEKLIEQGWNGLISSPKIVNTLHSTNSRTSDQIRLGFESFFGDVLVGEPHVLSEGIRRANDFGESIFEASQMDFNSQTYRQAFKNAEDVIKPMCKYVDSDRMKMQRKGIEVIKEDD